MDAQCTQMIPLSGDVWFPGISKQVVRSSGRTGSCVFCIRACKHRYQELGPTKFIISKFQSRKLQKLSVQALSSASCHERVAK